MSNLNRRRILIIDDHPILLQGISEMIDREPDFSVCWHGGDPQEALKAGEECQPDVALVDISLKDVNGIELIQELKNRLPETAILVFSMHEESLYAEHAIRAGAKGYLMKREPSQKLFKAIRHILNGEIYLSERMRERMVYQAVSGRPSFGASPVERLSGRELEVFRLLGNGHGTRAIAQRLGLSVKTVETYRAHIMDKLSLQKATELVMHAYHWVNSDAANKTELEPA